MAEILITEKPICSNCGRTVKRKLSNMQGRGKAAGPLSGLFFCDRDCQKRKFRHIAKCVWPGCGAERLVEGGNARRKANSHYFCLDHTEQMQKAIGSRVVTQNKANICKNEPINHGRMTSAFLKWLVFKIDGGKCRKCSKILDFHAQPRDFHLDHVIPRWIGGLTRIGNLQTLCLDCHSEKTSIEQKEVNKTRWNKRIGANQRSLSHFEKDQLIGKLLARIAELESALAGDYQNG